VANLWQIGFGRIRCPCLISQNTFTCNMFAWSRLGDLNPGPTHYDSVACRRDARRYMSYRHGTSANGPFYVAV
jgi:hypothetical protein